MPIEERFPSFRRWIVECSACGRRGLTDSVDWDATESDLPGASGPWGWGPWFKPELQRQYDVLPLDELGRCRVCAAVDSPN